ncbi:MAG: hypothetical protein QM691_05800 [Opitutaceae bacterium]
MNLKSIYQEISEVLRKNPTKVDARRRAVAALRKGLEKGTSLSLPRRRAWFSTTQTDTMHGKAGARVQVLGIEAGELLLSPEAAGGYMFVPNTKLFPHHAGVRWVWSGKTSDGKKIRAFLQQECEGHPQADRSNEREIQWQLAAALGAKSDELRNLAAVKWNKRFTEIGVSVTKDGKAGTGNIDLVVRRGKGSDRGFLVFEIKAPGEDDVEATLKQSLGYATALSIEANEGPLHYRRDYNAVFGSGAAKRLQIDAVIAMEDCPAVRRRASSLVRQCLADRGGSSIERIGVLLYSFDRKIGSVRHWKWLEGFDPRQPLQ